MGGDAKDSERGPQPNPVQEPYLLWHFRQSALPALLALRKGAFPLLWTSWHEAHSTFPLKSGIPATTRLLLDGETKPPSAVANAPS